MRTISQHLDAHTPSLPTLQFSTRSGQMFEEKEGVLTSTPVTSDLAPWDWNLVTIGKVSLPHSIYCWESSSSRRRNYRCRGSADGGRAGRGGGNQQNRGTTLRPSVSVSTPDEASSDNPLKRNCLVTYVSPSLFLGCLCCSLWVFASVCHECLFKKPLYLFSVDFFLS
ncbi:unnamed protein product [Acanthosepion pharaonis]|uniref:Uncharacterized protein n=1 Tax=Acanthosepion pharaonis TaxID=158019 RepID=A0A812B4H1_ACAPH|nr:unnamed protein product [Sepia pharaonis]